MKTCLKQIVTIILLGIIISFGKLYAQTATPPYSEEVIPASPTMSELGKYGAYPVGYYTGTPNINIPLYTLKTGNFSLPISLSYHASGIRVDDIASWIGLGWSLNAGGIIHVNIKGQEDVKFSTRNTPFTINDLLNKINTDAVPDWDYLNKLSQIPSSVEAQPDIYNYNFAGYSGQFLIDENNQIRTFSNDGGLRFYFTRKTITSSPPRYCLEFLVIDSKGRKYYFVEYETTTQEKRSFGINDVRGVGVFAEGSRYGSTSSITGYYLDKIELENGKDVIRFEYRNETIIDHSRITGRMKSNEDKTQWLFGLGDGFYGSIVTHNVKQIKKIFDNRGNRIEFNEGLESGGILTREDLTGTNYPLSTIKVYQNNIKVLEWRLVHDYFISNTDMNLTNLLYHSKNHYRLRLSKIIQYNNDGTESINPYIFEYYGDNDANLKLPPRNSYYGVDFWGYCNAPTLSSDKPKVQNAYKSFPVIDNSNRYQYTSYANIWTYGSLESTLSYTLPLFSMGSSKDPNEIYAKSYSLKKITFPTNGTTELIYEGHKNINLNTGPVKINCGGLRIYKTLTSHQEGKIMIKEFSYNDGSTPGLPNYASANLDFFNASIMGVKSVNLHNSVHNGLTLYDGETVGYRQVTERDLSGESTYRFFNFFDMNIQGINYPDFISVIVNVKLDLNDENPLIFESYTYQNLTTSFNFQKTIEPFPESNWMHFNGKGLIKELEVKDNENKRVKLEEYIYSFLEGYQVYGNKAYIYRVAVSPWSPVYKDLFLQSYYIQTGKSFLKSKIVTDYTTDGVSMNPKITEYIYDTNYELLKEEKSTNSSGDEIKTKYIYSIDFGSYVPCYDDLQAIQEMKQRNITSQPIEIIKYVNEKITDGIYNEYRNENDDLIVLNKVRNLETTEALVETTGSDNTKYRQSYVGYDGSKYFVVEDNHYKPLTETLEYDEWGNPLQLKKINSENTSYIWGYNHQYPIAKILNS